MTSRPTIKDIARHAEVSFKTVSRVINKEAGVNPGLREKVQAAIAELGYQPHLGARQMRSGKTGAIALFATSRAEVGALHQSHRMPSYVSDVVTGMLQACNATGHHLVIDNIASYEEGEGSEAMLRFLDQVRPDGVLLIPPLCDVEWILAVLERRKVPVARFNPGTRLDQGYWIGIDNVKAGADVGHLLLDNGHLRIGYISGPDAHKANKGRLVGLRQAIEEVEGVHLTILPGDFLFESGRIKGGELLDMPERPTAIFAANDEMAAGVLAAAVERGIGVPNLLSIVGFGGLIISSQTWPRLSTVSQPTIEMARRATEYLVSASISEQHAHCNGGLVPHELVIRQSTATTP